MKKLTTNGLSKPTAVTESPQARKRRLQNCHFRRWVIIPEEGGNPVPSPSMGEEPVLSIAEGMGVKIQPLPFDGGMGIAPVQFRACPERNRRDGGDRVPLEIVS